MMASSKRPVSAGSIGFCTCGAQIIIGGKTIHRPGCQQNMLGKPVAKPATETEG